MKIFLQSGSVEAGLTRKYLRKAAEARKRGKQRKELKRLNDEEADKEMRKLELQGDRYGIIAAMFMQDGPFLILRLYLVIKYDFFMDSTFMFYVGKNIISSVDDIPSLCHSLSCEGRRIIAVRKILGNKRISNPLICVDWSS